MSELRGCRQLGTRCVRGCTVALPLVLAAACASSGTSQDPMPVVAAPVVATPAPPPPPSMRDLYEAGDYPGTIRAFLADTILATRDTAVFRAAIASAMPGHAAHDPDRALKLLTRLLTEHPDSEYVPEARLIIDLLDDKVTLRRANKRLQRELEQLKAIDLGQQP